MQICYYIYAFHVMRTLMHNMTHNPLSQLQENKEDLVALLKSKDEAQRIDWCLDHCVDHKRRVYQRTDSIKQMHAAMLAAVSHGAAQTQISLAMPRRLGRTAGLAMFIAALFHSRDAVRIAVVSQNYRIAEGLCGKVWRMLVGFPLCNSISLKDRRILKFGDSWVTFHSRADDPDPSELVTFIDDMECLPGYFVDKVMHPILGVDEHVIIGIRTPTPRDIYEAWRRGVADDLILALFGEANRTTPLFEPRLMVMLLRDHLPVIAPYRPPELRIDANVVVQPLVDALCNRGMLALKGNTTRVVE